MHKLTNFNRINNCFLKSNAFFQQTLLKYSKLITFIDDLKFQITKENKPSELLRNLEIFVKDSGKFFHIDDTGTGTQSAVIIGVLELALSYKASQSKIFIIEEPELYLHPQGIRYLSSLFDDFIQDGPSQIITTTHSATLISTFNPKQLIRFDKSSGESKVFQLPVNFIDVGEKVTRSLNSENAEMFFADKVLLVEGETEKIIFPELSKRLTLNNDSSAYFLKNNLSTVNVGGKDNIISYIKILDAFHIQWRAIVDDDYLDRKSTYSPTCAYFGIDKTAGKEALRAELLKFGIAILKEGETKDLVSNVDLATMVGKSSLEIETIKNRHAKTSEAFEKEIFNLSKPVYAFILVDFYMPQNSSPFDDLIKWAIG